MKIVTRLGYWIYQLAVLVELPIIFLHEFCHFLPAWLFGLKPRMYLFVKYPQVRYRLYPTTSMFVRMLISLAPALAAIPPTILIVCISKYIVIQKLTVLYKLMVALWVLNIFWYVACWRDVADVIMMSTTSANHLEFATNGCF